MKKIMKLDVRELVIRNKCFMDSDYLKKAPEWAIPKWESNPDKNDTTKNGWHITVPPSL